MDLGIEGRVALVTASSKGLGRASAEALAADGARMVICARGREALDETASAITAAGGEVLPIVADVTDPAVPAELVAAAVERWGRLDIVVGNAGGPPPGAALDVDDDALGAAINANLLTSVRLVRAAVPHLRANGWGRICLITSSSVRQPIPFLALSNTARAGLWGWAKTAAQDLVSDGITLNLACPGLHATDRVRQLGGGSDGGGRPIGDPGDFGKVVAFLCSEPAGYISGTAVGVDGASVAGLL
ncbi:MAG TPA: SDR family oxidoreductase [Acidimicrobiales bacterium]|nr:SDR family oxidoreductase [Acidimicrobiales bacterium]